MGIETKTINSLEFSYLPSYAQYLIDHKLEAFVQLQHEIGEQLDIPLLKVFKDWPADKLRALALQTTTEYLGLLASNKADKYIQDSITKWLANTLPYIDKHEVITEDLSLISYMRKKVFLHFLPGYSSNLDQIIPLLEEIDYFLSRFTAATTETYIKLLEGKIAQHTHFIEKINSTSPSMIYVYDIQEQKTIYTNEKFKDILGFTGESIEKLNVDLLSTLIHPDHLPEIKDYFESFQYITDKDTRSIKYRIKDQNGQYRWVRNYDTVFKRNEDGRVQQIIGVVIDVNKEKTIADELRRREEQLTEAQALAHIGSWSWNLETGEILWSDEMYRIYGLNKNGNHLRYDFVISQTLQEDQEHVKQKMHEAIERKASTTFQFRIGITATSLKYVQATAEVRVDNNGKAVEVLGTVQDITEQQNLIDKLQYSESLYKQAQSLARLGNWSLDLTNNEISWSDEMYNIYELDKDDKITLERWIEFIYSEDKEEILAYWQECLHEKHSYNKVHRVLLSNNKVKTLHRRGEFIFDSNGEPIKMIGTTQDVTEQYRIQQELKENQTFIQKITDAAPSIITSFNTITNQYEFVNEGLRKLLGYDPKEFIGKDSSVFTELVHPEDIFSLVQASLSSLQEANDKPLENGIAEFTYRIRHKDGSYRWVTTYATVFDRNPQGQVERVLRISLDVTEHAEARKKIEEQELFIKQVADASPTILYLFDTKLNQFNYINHEIYYALGYTPEEILDMKENVITRLYHPDDMHLLPERQQSEKKFQHTNSMMQYECRMQNKTGDWCWLVIREVIFKRSENGKPVQILGAALDITKRKEMEKSLLQNAYQLRQSNASLEEFAYVASHDLKEPLRKISTFGDRILQTQQERLNEDGKVYLKKIIDASQRMQTMINDLLSISMITGDRSFQRYNLQYILEEVKLTLEYKIEKIDAIIDATQLPEANIIPSQIRQLFQNLLSNSLKFARDNVQPHIQIEWKYVSPEEINNIQVNKATQYLKLDFIDNGIGFEEEYAGKIFQIFQRLHGRSEYEGTGIGLAICKKIVEHHGGTIYAHGYPGRGATFTIILPA